MHKKCGLSFVDFQLFFFNKIAQANKSVHEKKKLLEITRPFCHQGLLLAYYELKIDKTKPTFFMHISFCLLETTWFQ